MTIPAPAQPPPQADPTRFLLDLGYTLKHPVQIDGKIHRLGHSCKAGSDDASYYLFRSSPVPFGFVGCWRCGDHDLWNGLGRKLTAEEKALLDEANKLSAQQLKEQQLAISEGVTTAYRELDFCPPDHPYLVKKRIKPHGAKVRNGILLIALQDVSGRIWSGQGIAAEPHPALGGKTKMFEPGGRTKGCFYLIGDLKEAPQVLLCEGYATACTLHEATGLTVVAAMSANNLEPVAKAIRNAFPRLSITVCSDSDRHTKGNPGETAAEAASLSVGGAFAVPDFKGFPDDKDHTDFNDLARVVSLDRVREIVMAAVPPPRPVLIYCSPTGRWFSLSGPEFIQIDQGATVRRLHISGVGKFAAKGEPSPMDIELDRLMHEDSVSYAGPLAGWPRGVVTMNRRRILITAGVTLPMPGPGGCAELLQILHDMLGREQLIQSILWIQVARRRIITGQWHPLPALALIGEKNSGKSFYQSAVIPFCLGGRVGKPAQYMQGITPFNSDLMGAEVLAFEDETQRRDAASRRHFGESIKSMLFARDVHCHPKHGIPVVLRPIWALTISVNDDPEHLQVLPQIDDSLSDKLLMLKCVKAPRAVPDGVNETAWLEHLVRIQGPAFLRLVDSHPFPEKHFDARTRIKGWQNPDILTAIEGLSPELQLLNLIDDVLFAGSVVLSTWTGTSEQLSRELRASQYTREVEKLFSWPTACGVYLGRLAQSRPHRVGMSRKTSGRIWSISPPGTEF